MNGLSVQVNGKLGELNFNFKHHFKNKGITTLFGPIGSGKSTLVNTIGGFNQQLKAKILLNGTELQGKDFIKPRYRPIAIMFQENRLIESLTIMENLKFAEDKSKNKLCSTGLVNKDYIIEKLNINDKLFKYPNNLSTGEKQLVSLARTLLISSELIILDEPTSSLDLRTKTKILSFLKDFNSQFNLPILLISHSLEEIVQISDEIVLINKGNFVTSGKVSEIMIEKEFKNFFGKFESGAILNGLVIEKEKNFNLTKIEVENQILILPGNFKKKGDKIRVRIRARDVIVSKINLKKVFIENVLKGKITEIILEKDTAFAEILIKISTDKSFQFFRARITKYNLKTMNLKIKDNIYAHLRSVSFDRQAII